ncbi:MAG: NAD-binding protein [Acidobacteriota bacterium]
MKYLPSQLAFFFTEPGMRTNIRSLVRYLVFLAALVGVYAVLFHVIMERAEGQSHSWMTGFYWTLVVMTTLGFGDITFTTDLGRAFSIIVLLSGVILLLVMLPFLFIRLFYAPWLEARVRLRAPREVDAAIEHHVVITEHDPVAVALVRRLSVAGLPYVIVEPDPARAAQLVGDGFSVMAGDIDSADTFRAAGVERAAMVLANREDTTNTNITLTVREVSNRVSVVAIAEDDDAVDVLQLAGATRVLPLKRELGEYLANRCDVGRVEAHVVGQYRGLQVAELAARGTPFIGQSVRDTRLRETTGMSIIGIWERGRLQPASPQTQIRDSNVIVVAGTADQIRSLNAQLPSGPDGDAPVLIIGAGRVGQAAALHLARKGIRARVVDRDPRGLAVVREVAERVVEGDAADRTVLHEAGLHEAASVLLTTNDDAVNIYLAVFCRKLRPSARIISRITYDRNVEAIHRAGADFVLSYASLGAQGVFALLKGHELVILGEGVDLFTRPVPEELEGRTLREGAIGSLTGLCVIAIQDGDRFITPLHSNTVLPRGSELVMIGSLEQRRAFTDRYGAPRRQPR